jgi:hypothetical protein
MQDGTSSDMTEIAAQFGERKKQAQARYRKFVIEGIAGESPWKDLNAQIFPGDKDFIRRIKTAPAGRAGEQGGEADH